VFHHHYYNVVSRVKCSLSRSDGDSNRFLTSWWFIPHTNHTHPLKWAQITNDTIQVNVAGETRAAVPRDHPTARTHLGLTLRIPVIPPSAPLSLSTLAAMGAQPLSLSFALEFGLHMCCHRAKVSHWHVHGVACYWPSKNLANITCCCWWWWMTQVNCLVDGRVD
jgi:hypothetical protein